MGTDAFAESPSSGALGGLGAAEGPPAVAANDVEKLSPTPPGPQTENDLYQPKSLRFWLILVCNFMALFLVAIDRTIIATAVPTISDEFHALGDIGWYGSAYMLTTSCAQLVYGRIYKFYDMKWVFIASIVVFEVGSTICGAAKNSPVFIIGRAIAGLASAGIFSGAMLIMIPMIPLHRRPMFQGLFGMVFGLASVMGPLVGGAFTTKVTWRWCFYINLPIGAVSLIFMILFWNPPKQKHEPARFMEHVKRLDPIGMLFFLPGCVCLLLGLQWGGATYDWSDWRIITLFVVFAVATSAFIAVEILKPNTAMVPPKVITQRSVAFGTGFTFFLAGSMLMMVYYVPIWFQTVKMVNPMDSGIYTLPLVLSLVVSSIIAGIVTQKIGYYVPSMLIAPAIMSIGEGLMTTFNPDTPSSQWIAYQFLAGFGLGFGMQTSGLAIQTVLPREEVSAGIAINFFVQQLGGAIFTSVGQTILSNLLGSKLAGVPGLGGKIIVSEGATSLVHLVPPEYVSVVIDAYNYSCQRVFMCSLGLAFAALLCAFGMEWRSIKKGRNGQDVPAGAPPGAGASGSVGPGGPQGGDGATGLSNMSKDMTPLQSEDQRREAEKNRSVSDGGRPDILSKPLPTPGLTRSSTRSGGGHGNHTGAPFFQQAGARKGLGAGDESTSSLHSFASTHEGHGKRDPVLPAGLPLCHACGR